LAPPDGFAAHGSIPEGTGYGSITVSSNGRVVLVARSPDDRLLLVSNALGPQGEVQLHFGLYNQNGAINGQLNLMTRDTERLEGNLLWSKRPVAKTPLTDFPNGFQRVELAASGGTYEQYTPTQNFLEPPPVTQGPTINSFSPSIGGVGQWVQVNGTNFVHGQTSVLLENLPFIAATVYSSTQLGFRIPAEATGSFPVCIQTALGSACSQLHFSVGMPSNPPTIERFYPSLGPPGQWVYVFGDGFATNQTSVSLAQTTGISTTVYGPTQLGFRVPVGASGVSAIELGTPNGTAVSTGHFTIGVPSSSPIATTVRPSFGPTGQWVYVYGENFMFGQTTVSVGGVSNIAATVYGPDQLGFRVPIGAAGTDPVTITTPNGASASQTIFTVGQTGDLPRVFSFSPTIAAPKARITVLGENFVLGGTTVTVGGVSGVATSVKSPTELSFELPTTASGNSLLTLHTVLGAYSSEHIFSVSTEPLNSSLILTGGGIEEVRWRPDVQFRIQSSTKLFIPYPVSPTGQSRPTIRFYPKTGIFEGSCAVGDIDPITSNWAKRLMRFRGILTPTSSGFRHGVGTFRPAPVPRSANLDLGIWKLSFGTVKIASIGNVTD
jgi:hypothetical protein